MVSALIVLMSKQLYKCGKMCTLKCYVLLYTHLYIQYTLYLRETYF